MKKETSTISNSLRSHLTNERALICCRLLIVEWKQFWSGTGGFKRQKNRKSIQTAEDFVLERFEWIRDAVQLQRRARDAQTGTGRKMAILHLESLSACCDEIEILLRTRK